MKATELMAGDWFMFDTEHYEPYERVREYSQVEHFNYGVVYGNSGCIAYCEDYQSYNERKYEKVMPIPLTEAILKANGFEYREFTSHESMHYNHSVTIYLNKDGEIFMLIGGEQRWMRYVHQLQHALRLCGLNELADNFKIE